MKKEGYAAHQLAVAQQFSSVIFPIVKSDFLQFNAKQERLQKKFSEGYKSIMFWREIAVKAAIKCQNRYVIAEKCGVKNDGLTMPDWAVFLS